MGEKQELQQTEKPTSEELIIQFLALVTAAILTTGTILIGFGLCFFFKEFLSNI